MAPDQGTSPEIPENEDYKAGQRLYHDEGGTPGAEAGENSDAADTPPGLPADHDAEFGSTDQHSDA